ncbi:unnamed protein product [Caenorhabditis nigoni]
MSSTIPDANRKLSYDCLKCVIQKLEVNFRFRLADRIPKIKRFEVNNTKYQFGVIRQSREGPNNEIIENDNRRGGIEIDIDRFGFENYSLPELTPGDILIQDFYPQKELDLESVEARVVASRNRLTVLGRHKMELENSSEEDLANIPMEKERDQLERRNETLSRDERLERNNQSIRYVKEALEREEFDLQRYQCKRDNLPSPFDMFLQLTKTSSDGTVYIERFNYDKSLMEARKYLICKFLGNRPSVTKIKSLSFWSHEDEGLVIGLPEGIKLDVQEFGTSGNLSEVLKRVETILEHPNRPFACLESDDIRMEDAQNPKVRNAEVLWLYDNYNDDFTALCCELPNKKIVIDGCLAMQPRGYAMIVENLIDTKGTLGTCYEIRQSREKKTIEAMRLIANRFENAVVGERLVTIPLPNQLQLDVSYAPFQFDSDTVLYTIKMEVVQSRNN